MIRSPLCHLLIALFATAVTVPVVPAVAATEAEIEARLNKAGNILLKYMRRTKELEQRLDRQADAIDQLSIGKMSNESLPVDAGADEEIDLDLDSPEQLEPASSKYGQHASAVKKHITIYVDAALTSLKGADNLGSGLTFSNFHSFFILDVSATLEISFTGEISGSPRFYEIGYQPYDWLKFRMGKILVPFDDREIHSIYGGKTNVINISPDGTFVPYLWGDLGVDVQLQLIDTTWLSSKLDIYVINGIGTGGTDPLEEAESFPDFTSIPSIGNDNNKSKAWGGRLHSTFFGNFGLGGSYYSGRWTDQTDPGKNIEIWAVDSQLRIPFLNHQIRVGYAQGTTDLLDINSDAVAIRRGFYGELTQSAWNSWKFIFRTGFLNLDDRIVDKNDQAWLTGMILYRPSVLQWSIEYSRDTKRTVDKGIYNYWAFRVTARL